MQRIIRRKGASFSSFSRLSSSTFPLFIVFLFLRKRFASPDRHSSRGKNPPVVGELGILARCYPPLVKRGSTQIKFMIVRDLGIILLKPASHVNTAKYVQSLRENCSGRINKGCLHMLQLSFRTPSKESSVVVFFKGNYRRTLVNLFLATLPSSDKSYMRYVGGKFYL